MRKQRNLIQLNENVSRILNNHLKFYFPEHEIPILL